MNGSAFISRILPRSHHVLTKSNHSLLLCFFEHESKGLMSHYPSSDKLKEWIYCPSNRISQQDQRGPPIPKIQLDCFILVVVDGTMERYFLEPEKCFRSHIIFVPHAWLKKISGLIFFFILVENISRRATDFEARKIEKESITFPLLLVSNCAYTSFFTGSLEEMFRD